MSPVTIHRRTARSDAATRRSILARVITLVCITAAMIGLSSPHAAAISRYTVWQGSPGALTRSPQAIGWASYAGLRPTVDFQLAHVRRSPLTAGAQTVVYEYRVYGWTGSSWFLGSRSGSLSGTIPAGQNAVVLTGGGWGGSVQLPAHINGGGYIAAELAVSFYSGGQFLGRFNVWLDQPQDYACNRAVTLHGVCSVQPGGFLHLS